MSKAKYTKKQKLGIFSLSIIIILSVMSITGTLPLASLFGGDSSNIYGGQFTASSSNQMGETTTSFPSCDVDHIDFSVTNNANSNYILTGQPYSVDRYTITTSETTENYQMKITVNKEVGMNSDLSNVRFSETDGTPIPQYRESYIEDTSAVYWIKTDLEGGKNIDIAYGGDLPLKSNPEEVFDFYDGFNDNSLDTSKWIVRQGAFTFADGQLISTGTTGTRGIIDSTFTTSKPVIMEWSQKFNKVSATSASTHVGLRETNTFDNRYGDLYISGSEQRYTISNGGTANENTISLTDATSFNTYKIEVIDTTSKLYQNDILESTHSTNVPSGNEGIFVYEGNDATRIEYLDWVRVRKYLATEPTIEPALGITLADTGFQFSNVKILTIDNTGNPALSGYQHLETIAYESEMQIDMDDIVFTELDGTIIPHYTESVIDSTSADVYIKISADADSTKQILMYYGNSIIPDMSDSDIFEFFDDFSGDALDVSKWTGKTSNAAVSSGILYYGGDNTQDKLFSSTSFDYDVALHARIKYVTSGTYISRFGLSDDSGDNYVNVQVNYVPENIVRTCIGGTGSNSNTNLPLNTWHDLDMNIISGTSVEWYIDDVLGSGTNPKTTDIPSTSMKVMFVGRDSSIATIECNYVYVTKYTANPPSISFGSGNTLFNPTFTTTLTGDSNEQEIGSTATFTLTPTSDIDNFVVDGSLDYDFTATIYYTGTTTVSSQNSTSGDIEFTFTPTIAMTEGFANAVFDEDIIFEYPEVIAILDGESANVVFENNNTISVELGATDTSEHTIIASVVNNPPETPTTPSSGGGGGGAAPATSEEETTVEDSTEQTIDTKKSDQMLDFSIFNSDSSIIILFVIGTISIILIANLYRKKK